MSHYLFLNNKTSYTPTSCVSHFCVSYCSCNNMSPTNPFKPIMHYTHLYILSRPVKYHIHFLSGTMHFLCHVILSVPSPLLLNRCIFNSSAGSLSCAYCQRNNMNSITKICRQHEKTWSSLQRRIAGIPFQYSNLFDQHIQQFVHNKAISLGSCIGYFAPTLMATSGQKRCHCSYDDASSASQYIYHDYWLSLGLENRQP